METHQYICYIHAKDEYMYIYEYVCMCFIHTHTHICYLETSMTYGR